MDSKTSIVRKDLAAVVLIGGKSKRMGTPKACIEVDGEKLALRTARLLSRFTDEIYLSGRTEQKSLIEEAPYTFIPDNYPDIGPIAGILSVFEFLGDPSKALLIVATDLPYLDEHTLNLLISKRNPAKQLTLFQQRGSGFLEPLCTIYEPDAYEQIKKEQEKGEYALHRIFRPGQMELIKYNKGQSLTNLNYPGQLKEIGKQA